MTSPTTSAGPPTSSAAVAVQLSWSDLSEESLTKLDATVAAVNELVPRIARTGPAAQALGATMLAARLYRRRNSPEGVASFTQDGAVYVQKSDPDVAMLLGLGSWSTPVVG
jgi:hypothetical protein